MKLQLTNSEFKAMHDLLQSVVIGVKPKTPEQYVLHGVLFRLFKKFYVKALVQKKKYSLSMADDEACSFLLYFSKYHIPVNYSVQTNNLVLQIINTTNQKYNA